MEKELGIMCIFRFVKKGVVTAISYLMREKKTK